MALNRDSLGKYSDGVQYKLVSRGSRGYADMAVAADQYVVGQLPQGAVITAAYIHINTVFDATLEKVDVDLVKESDGTGAIVVHADVDALAAGRTEATGAAITQEPLTEPYLVVVGVDVGGNTQGEVAVEIEYHVVGRSNENSG